MHWGKFAVTLTASAIAAGGHAAAHASVGPGGQPGQFTMVEEAFTERTVVSVNVASGNLLVESRDLAPSPESYGVEYDRVYNSSDASAGIVGPGWALDVDPDVRIEATGPAAIRLHAPDGARVDLVDSDADGQFEGPLFNGVVTTDANGGYRYERQDAAVDYLFDAGGSLVQVQTDEGLFTVQRTSAGGRTVLSSFGTPDGRRINLSYDGTGRVRLIDDPASRHRYYRYDLSGRLVQYESPEGVERYSYDAGGRLASIHAPNGAAVMASYDSAGRVTELSIMSPTGVTRSTTIDYAASQTIVHRPDGASTTYAYDADLFVESEFAGVQPPDVQLSGPLAVARRTVLAQGAYGLSYSASGGAGLLDVTVNLAEPDDLSGLPSGVWTLHTLDFSKGRAIVEVTAADDFGNRRTERLWIDIPEPAYLDGDGSMPGDDDPSVAALQALPLAPCPERYGVDSPLCQPPHSGSPGKVFGLSEDDNAWAKRTDVTSILESDRFKDLNVIKLRRVLAWNIARREGRLARFDEWYAKAAGMGPDVEIMVAFQLPCHDDSDLSGHCYRQKKDESGLPESGREAPPLKAEYVNAVYDFVSLFPRVTYISAWNEPNHARQPLNPRNPHGGGPRRAAKYTYWLEEKVCSQLRATRPCHVVAGDFYGNIPKGEQDYARTYKRKLASLFSDAPQGVVEPGIWAFHPYADINQRRSIRAKKTSVQWMLKNIPEGTRLWLTEGGSRIEKLPEDTPETEQTHKERVAFYLDDLGGFGRVDRVYYYSLCPGDREFDSGLLDDDNAGYFCGDAKRDAYDVFERRSAG